jgi:hypothetical protein
MCEGPMQKEKISLDPFAQALDSLTKVLIEKKLILSETLLFKGLNILLNSPGSFNNAT